MSADPFNHFSLDRLRVGVKPLRLHWFARLRSTNDHAAYLRGRGELFAPAIVLSGRQIAGRGRGSNRWFSAKGSLTATFVFPVEEHLSAQQIPLVAGLAVRDAAVELVDDPSIAMKWPNDVLHDDRKLAGLLCERVSKADLIGVGMNVNLQRRDVPLALRRQITSLAQIAGRAIDLTDALIVLSRHMHAAMARRGDRLFAETLARYDRHHALIDRKVSVIEAGSDRLISGRCAGLDSAGRLLLRDGRQTHTILAGQVRMH